MPSLVRRNAIGSVYAVLRVSPLSVMTRSGKSYADAAVSDEMREMLRKLQRSAASTQVRLHGRARSWAPKPSRPFSDSSPASSLRSTEAPHDLKVPFDAYSGTASEHPVDLQGARSRANTMQSSTASFDPYEVHQADWASPAVLPTAQQRSQELASRGEAPITNYSDDFEKPFSGSLAPASASMMRICSALLTVACIGSLVVTSVFAAHQAVKGTKAGEKFSMCIVPFLAISILAICLFMRSHYVGHSKAILKRISKARLSTYARELMFIVLQLFLLFFMVTQAVDRMKSSLDSKEYVHFTHIALFTQRTFCLVAVMLLDRASPRGHLSGPALETSRNFHSLMVLFTLVSNLAFSLFFCLEMGSTDRSIHVVPEGVFATRSEPHFKHEPKWLTLLLPVWLLDITVVLWFRKSWIITLRGFCRSSSDENQSESQVADERSYLLA